MILRYNMSSLGNQSVELVSENEIDLTVLLWLIELTAGRVDNDIGPLLHRKLMPIMTGAEARG